MPPRFWSSPYKNALLTPAKRDGWFCELPTAGAAGGECADPLVTAGSYLLAQGSAAGSLAVLSWDAPGKYGGKAATLQTGLGRVSALGADSWGELVAAGGDGGQINVLALLPHDALDPGVPYAPTSLFSASTSSGKPIDTLCFHPLASSLFLATSGTSLSIFDATSQASTAAYSIEMPVQAWSAAWSADGRSVSAGGRDGRLRLWDVRAGGAAVLEIASHAGIKPSRHVHLSHLPHPALLTTGVSRTRDREFSIHDLRTGGGSSAPLKTQRIDSGTGTLVPLLDAGRGIVYLAGRGDHTLRWVEVPSSAGQSAPYTEGACALPLPLLGAALAPPRAWDLMRAEIGRVAVLGPAGEIVPVRVEVPRRQYLDFHKELYPPVAAGVPAQSAAEWCAAEPADVRVLERRQLDPSVPWPVEARQAQDPASSPARVPAPVVQEERAPSPPVAEATPSQEPPAAAAVNARPAFGPKKPVQAAAPLSTPAGVPAPKPAPSPAPPAAQLEKVSLSDTARAAAPTPTPAPSRSEPSATSARPKTLGAANAPGELFNPGWSRKFLTGKTPLKPEFFDLHDLSTTMSADVALLKASPSYLFFPLSGPGGRLAFHPLSHPGRLPVHPSCVAVGGSVIEFAVDPFDARRVFVAGDDGAVRVFKLPEVGEWQEGETRGEAERVLSDPKMDRISDLLHHPAAKDLLLTVSDDRGNPTARLWDVATGERVLEVSLPKGGVSSAAWSPSGTRLALATKNKQLHVLDPRDPAQTLVTTAAHDSIRPARLAWASETHLVSSGFNRSASRELILFRLGGDKLEKLGTTTLDVSVAPLFPFVDLDTRIVLLHSRGDRSCLAYEVDLAPSSPYSAFAQLPAFEGAGLQSGWAFLPKARGDVRKVEIIKGLRLTPSTIEVVGFTVPRAKAEFFQNDIFVPTRNVEKPSMTAAEWLAGENRPLELIDLRPEGMELLSHAPAPVKNVSTRSKIKQDGLTDSQREAQHLDHLFETAKADEDVEEEDVQPVRAKHRIEQDDDDW